MRTIVKTENEKLEALLQAYARAKWGADPDKETAEHLAARLDQRLRDRIDILGLDGARLLSVDTANVLAELEALEKEAALEDAGAKPAAAKIRAQEVDGQARMPRLGHRAHPGKHRGPARPRPRRQHQR